MALKKIFTHNLRMLRRNAKLSQMRLAELCDTSTSYIGRIEIGLHFPSAEMIDKIARSLQIRPYQLFLEKPAKPFYKKPELPAFIKKEVLAKLNAAVQTVRRY
ncbi:MAG: helix-turn-helix domain-containing protein [Candidatus Margulisbacteria bacterium]|jgi:transcriptional regulator with XRE-family HTH domain|nr:helix-turn-helix domain-containing protein [Candidatus Margulisiibacteriota bacterium]